MNERYPRPALFAVFEREPRMNAEPNRIIFGPYGSASDAEEHRIKYGFIDENYYVAQIAPDHYSPL
jgi:hypothetical protein